MSVYKYSPMPTMEYPSIRTIKKILDYNLEDAGIERSIQEVIIKIKNKRR